MFHQVIEERKSRMVDEGTMGFHDYVEKYDISFEEFVANITKKYSRDDIEVLSISYPTDKKAVIVYKEVLKTIGEWEKVFDTFVMDADGFPKDTDIYETLYSKVDFLNYVQKSTVKFSDTLLKELNIELEKTDK